MKGSSPCSIAVHAAGRPIVTQSWVTASSKSGSFIPALDHLLVDRAAEQKFGFSLSTAYQAAQRRLLLTDTTVFLAPGAQLCPSPQGECVQAYHCFACKSENIPAAHCFGFGGPPGLLVILVHLCFPLW